jgi:pyruvate formate lyase activating enzyme
MMIGNINSIETFGTVDGPGIRVVVFMQGCPMRCIFCHNPEMWTTDNGVYQYSSQQLLNIILKYKSYFNNGGGVTFSGGEPLYQSAFLLEVLKLCQKNNIHTCLDTSGGGGTNYEEILKYVDLVMLDIKHINEKEYKEITGCDIKSSLDFLKCCQKLNKKLWLRQVIIPNINDNEEYIYQLKSFIKNLTNVEKIELLPYHNMGEEKYRKLGLEYKLQGLDNLSNNKLDDYYKILNY